MTRKHVERGTVRRAAGAAVVAATVNVALLLVGRAAGASFRVPDRAQEGAVVDVGLVAVLVSTLVPLVAGLGATAMITRRRSQARRVLQALAVLVTLASVGMPLSTATDSATRVLLAVMHLVVGSAYVAAVPRHPSPARPTAAAGVPTLARVG